MKSVSMEFSAIKSTVSTDDWKKSILSSFLWSWGEGLLSHLQPLHPKKDLCEGAGRVKDTVHGYGWDWVLSMCCPLKWEPFTDLPAS